MDITDDWLKNGIATVAITGYKGARNAEDREPIREHVVRLDYLRELLKTHSIVPNEPTDLQIQEGRYKIPLGGAHLATDRDMVLVYKAMIGVNDE